MSNNDALCCGLAGMLNQALNYSGVKKRLKHFLTKASNGEIKQLSPSTSQPLDHSQGNIYSVLKGFIHPADKEIFCFISFLKSAKSRSVELCQDHTIC